MTINGGPEVVGHFMFVKCVYLSVFYCLCYDKDRSIDMSEEKVAENRDIRNRMRRRKSDWMQLGQRIGGVLLRKSMIRIIFIY